MSFKKKGKAKKVQAALSTTTTINTETPHALGLSKDEVATIINCLESIDNMTAGIRSILSKHANISDLESNDKVSFAKESPKISPEFNFGLASSVSMNQSVSSDVDVSAAVSENDESKSNDSLDLTQFMNDNDDGSLLLLDFISLLPMIDAPDSMAGHLFYHKLKFNNKYHRNEEANISVLLKPDFRCLFEIDCNWDVDNNSYKFAKNASLTLPDKISFKFEIKYKMVSNNKAELMWDAKHDVKNFKKFDKIVKNVNFIKDVICYTRDENVIMYEKEDSNEKHGKSTKQVYSQRLRKIFLENETKEFDALISNISDKNENDNENDSGHASSKPRMHFKTQSMTTVTAQERRLKLKINSALQGAPSTYHNKYVNICKYYQIKPQKPYFYFGDWTLEKHEKNTKEKKHIKTKSKSKSNDLDNSTVASPKSVGSNGSTNSSHCVYILKRNGKRIFPILKAGYLKN